MSPDYRPVWAGLQGRRGLFDLLAMHKWNFASASDRMTNTSGPVGRRASLMRHCRCKNLTAHLFTPITNVCRSLSRWCCVCGTDFWWLFWFPVLVVVGGFIGHIGVYMYASLIIVWGFWRRLLSAIYRWFDYPHWLDFFFLIEVKYTTMTLHACTHTSVVRPVQNN